MSLNSNEREMLLQLLDDAEIIGSLFDGGTLPAPAITRVVFAPILRRWIVEGVFFKAQKLVEPYQVLFQTTSSDGAKSRCGDGMYEHWLESVVFGNLKISVRLRAVKYLNTDMGKDDGPQVAAVHGKAFFNQKMFYWNSRFYDRHDLIKVHANTLGGVHFDYKGTENDPHIRAVRACLGFELKPGPVQMLMGEEIEKARADLQRRHLVYDATEVITMDTARIFAAGVRASQAEFLRVLAVVP